LSTCAVLPHVLKHASASKLRERSWRCVVTHDKRILPSKLQDDWLHLEAALLLHFGANLPSMVRKLPLFMDVNFEDALLLHLGSGGGT
jgi:hypothetical protein